MRCLVFELSALNAWYNFSKGNSVFLISHYVTAVNFCLRFLGKGERDGIWAWHRINRLFNWLPLAALIEKKIICMHGGIGRSINHVEQIEKLQRPVTMEAGSGILMDLLWSVKTFYFSFCAFISLLC